MKIKKIKIQWWWKEKQLALLNKSQNIQNINQIILFNFMKKMNPQTLHILKAHKIQTALIYLMIQRLQEI